MQVREALDVWPGAAPGSEDARQQEAELQEPDSLVLRNVVRPTLTPYLPDPATATGTGVVIAPGGGFHFLVWDNEGTDHAEWLAGRGVAAFVLKYRLVDTGPTEEDYRRSVGLLMDQLLSNALSEGAVDVDELVPDVRRLAYADGQQAMRMARRHAADYGVDPARLGFLGFSAGAFVGVAAALTGDAEARPDFLAAVYGGHVPETVPDTAPPLFAVAAADDLLCRRTLLDTAHAWMEANRPTQLHMYDRGGHGFGARQLGLPVDTWRERLAEWMDASGFPVTSPARATVSC